MKILLIGGNGYIGSSYYTKSKYQLKSVDLCLFNPNLGYSCSVNYNYIDTINYDVIICLAGHSSVQMCNYSPSNAWENNVNYFRNLCEKLHKNQKLIYASSASVYGKSTGICTENSTINFNVINHYDLQKITIDLIANKYIAEGKNIIGLRFGTVNGLSPNTRADLVINSMVKSALLSNEIHIKNKFIRRAILGINDVAKVFDLLVEKNIPNGQYNISSFNTTIEKIGLTISNLTGAKIIEHGNDDLVYDFELSTEKFTKETEFKFTDTLDSIIRGLIVGFNECNFTIRNMDEKFKFYMSI